MSLLFDDALSKYQYGFRKGHNSQKLLLVMIGKWMEMLR